MSSYEISRSDQLHQLIDDTQSFVVQGAGGSLFSKNDPSLCARAALTFILEFDLDLWT